MLINLDDKSLGSVSKCNLINIKLRPSAVAVGLFFCLYSVKPSVLAELTLDTSALRKCSAFVEFTLRPYPLYSIRIFF